MPANDPLPAHLTAPGAVEHHHYTPTTRQVQKAVHQYLEEPANDAKIRDLIRKRIDEAVEVGVHVYLGSTPFEAMVTRAVAIYMRGNLEGHPTEMGAAEGLKALIQGELRTLDRQGLRGVRHEEAAGRVAHRVRRARGPSPRVPAELPFLPRRWQATLWRGAVPHLRLTDCRQPPQTRGT